MRNFIIHGDIIYSESVTKLVCRKNAYAVCENGLCAGVYDRIPAKFAGYKVIDYTGRLVLPGMVDLHLHAPQYAYRGLGMDLELLEWLQTYAFFEEAKYSDLKYAKKAYGVFVRAMKKSATTRAVIFATAHKDATILLMDMLDKTGIGAYVGKVNMDTDAPDNLREKDAKTSAEDTESWLDMVTGHYENCRPIVTPRFLPSCSHELMERLQGIVEERKLPVQSHLSENPEEVELVGRLYPEAAFYGDGYDRYHMFGGDVKTIMAHCVYSTEEEIKLLRDRGVFVAHCPSSNMNIASGIAPIRRYLTEGMKVGLGSDVAGGETESMFRAIRSAIQVSKLYYRLVDRNAAPITLDEAFAMATICGGEFFGMVGSFLPGYEFDAVVIDDRELYRSTKLTLHDRLERAVYEEADTYFLCAKYVAGRKVL